MRVSLLSLTLACGIITLVPAAARAKDVTKKYRPAVKKGLAWLVGRQHKDGHWSAANGQYRVTMTSLAGVALLAEGSTTRQGQYAANIRRAVDWLASQSTPGGGNGGLITEQGGPGAKARYMFGHGYAVLFLSCVYAGEQDKERRRMLEDVLTHAVRFSREAQTRRGGWGYVSAKDGNHFDEGASTVVQIHALRAARHAGIALPEGTWAKARKYLELATNAKGGVVYTLARGGGGGGRPPITAAAITAAFPPGEYNDPLAKKWIQFCRTKVLPLKDPRRGGYEEFTHFHYARVRYGLGDESYAKLFPHSKRSERLTWGKYRKETFDHLLKTQKEDGSWDSGSLGPVYPTASYLTVLQLDNGAIQFFRP